MLPDSICSKVFTRRSVFFLLCFFLVLPKFKVDVLTNTYAALGNGDIRGVVAAM